MMPNGGLSIGAVSNPRSDELDDDDDDDGEEQRLTEHDEAVAGALADLEPSAVVVRLLFNQVTLDDRADFLATYWIEHVVWHGGGAGHCGEQPDDPGASIR